MRSAVVLFLTLSLGASAQQLPCSALLADAPVMYPGGRVSVTPGDFNADGAQDVVMSGNAPLAVRYGRGDGTLGDPVELAPFSEAHRVADLNGDGLQDIVYNVAYSSSINATRFFVIYATGPRAYGAPVLIGSIPGFYASMAAVEDVTGDGLADVLVTDQTEIVKISRREDGTWFTHSMRIPGSYGRATVVDADADGNVDIIADTGDGIHLYRGDGKGSFAFAYPIGVRKSAIVLAGDMNGDGIADLVSLGRINHFIDVYLGPVTANAQPVSVLTAPAAMPHGVLADFNGDGTLDLGVHVQHQRFIVYANDGGGRLTQTFESVVHTAQTQDRNGIAAADMNDDGAIDVVATTRYGAAVIFNDGSGRFRTERVLRDLEPYQELVAAADVDNDGTDEVITASGFILEIAPAGITQLEDMHGGFLTGQITAAAGDVDPAPGIEIVTHDAASLHLHSRSSGTWRKIATWAAPFGPVKAAGIANGEIVFIAGDRLWRIVDGSVVSTMAAFETTQRFRIHVADMDGDGDDDVVVGRAGTPGDVYTGPLAYSAGTVYVTLANAEGDFGASKDVFRGPGIDDVTSGDFNRDGHRDLVIAGEAYDYSGSDPDDPYTGIYYLAGAGGSAFAEGIVISKTPFARVVAHDVNRDGYDDLAVNGRSGVEFFRGSPNGLVLDVIRDAGGQTGAWWEPPSIAIARSRRGLTVITAPAFLHAFDLTCVSRVRGVRK